MAEVEPDAIAEPDDVPDDPVSDLEPGAIAEPDAVRADLAADFDPDSMLEPKPVPPDPVGDVESDVIAEPDATPADLAADVDPDSILEPEPVPPDTMGDVELDTIEVDDAIAESPHPAISEVATGADARADDHDPAPHRRASAAERPSNIVEQFNDRFGDIPWADRDKTLRAVTEEIPAKVAADKAYRNAASFSDRQNAKIEHDHALQRVALTYLTTDVSLFKHFHDNPAFRDWLTDVNFSMTYEQIPRREDQDKDATPISNDDPDGMILQEVRNEASTLSPDALPAMPKLVSQPDPVAANPAAEIDTDQDHASDAIFADPVAEIEPEPVQAPDAAPVDPVAEMEPEPAQAPDAAPADPVGDVEPVPVQVPAHAPDAVPADPAAEIEHAPVQEPEYAAADAMTEPEPDTIAEPDTVSGNAGVGTRRRCRHRGSG